MARGRDTRQCANKTSRDDWMSDDVKSYCRFGGGAFFFLFFFFLFLFDASLGLFSLFVRQRWRRRMSRITSRDF